MDLEFLLSASILTNSAKSNFIVLLLWCTVPWYPLPYMSLRFVSIQISIILVFLVWFETPHRLRFLLHPLGPFGTCTWVIALKRMRSVGVKSLRRSAVPPKETTTREGGKGILTSSHRKEGICLLAKEVWPDLVVKVISFTGCCLIPTRWASRPIATCASYMWHLVPYNDCRS